MEALDGIYKVHADGQVILFSGFFLSRRQLLMQKILACDNRILQPAEPFMPPGAFDRAGDASHPALTWHMG